MKRCTSARLLLVYCLLFCGLYVSAQVRTITGTITDDQGRPVPGASVLIQGTRTGVTTNEEGRFQIDAKQGDVLEITSVGYAPVSQTVGAESDITIQLVSEATNLTDVVIIGYGSQQKKDLTGSVAVVDMDQLKRQPAASPIDGLQGKATGVQIITDGAPGSTPQIRVRGFSTINNNDPLYIIDGIPYEGKLSWLNANDIENMQVLKDASAASIYGARANNGVVIISTKKGRKGPPRVSLDMYYGTQHPNRGRFPKFLNPQQYAEYLYKSLKNAGLTPGNDNTSGANYGTNPDAPTLPEYLIAGNAFGQNVTDADADPSRYRYNLDAGEFYQITKANKAGTDWMNEITQNAPIQNYQLSISGGGEGSTYAVSGGYFNQEGTIKYTGFKRYNIRANTTFSLFNDRLKVGENMQYSYVRGFGFGVNPNTSGSYQGEGTALGWVYRMQTIVPVYDIMGNFAGTKGSKLGNAENPLAYLYRAKDNINNSGLFFGSAFADLTIVKGLNLRSTYGVRYENYNGLSISYPNPEFIEGSLTRNGLSEYNGYNTDWTWSNTLTYKNTFNDAHSLTVLAGTEAVESKNRQLNGDGNDFFILGDLNYYYLNTAASTTSGSTGAEGSLFSIFGRVDYNYKDKYLLSATVRRDGSSNFGPENKYGTFPAASAAWRISNEEFLQGTNWINDLKLRVGYGVTGNQRIPSFQYLRRYASGINQSFYPINGGNALTSGLWTSGYDNLAIQWEELKSLNIGLDFSILQNKLDGSVDWFTRQTNKVLYNVPQPATAVGQGASPYVNVGVIENKGFEFSLNYHYTGIGGDDAFKFDAGVNFSKYSNLMKELAPTVKEQAYNTIRGVTTSVLKPGTPFGAFYGYQVAGIFQDEDDIKNNASYEDARVGGFKFADLNGDGKIDDNDRTIIGSPHPDFVYSLSLNAFYKHFDISMFFNGSQGNDIFDLTRQYTDFNAFDGAVSTRVLDAWSPENPNSMMPSPYRNAPTIEYQSSSYYIQDGSFFRLKNLQLGYNFPVNKMFNQRISNLRLYVSATNLFTITKYSGLDPEVSQYSSTFSAPGVDIGIYPSPRQYLLGINVTF